MTMSEPNPEIQSAQLYQVVEDLLQRAGALLDAAETHGLLCGYLCAAPLPGQNPWLRHVLGEDHPGDEALREESRQALLRLKDYLAQQLAAPGMEFFPLLPDDSQPLTARAASLGGWSECFLFGFGLGSYRNLSELSPEGREFIRDMVSFSRLDGRTENSEESEDAYMQLVEYIRVGVLTLYEEQSHYGRNANHHGE